MPDDEATKKHETGSRPAAVFAGLVASGFKFRRFQLRWGATAAEADGGLRATASCPIADLQSTRAITIEAPADAVGPWLAQMGQGRGGLYSYDFLENLAGLDIHSADRIHPEWQDIETGDRFHLAPAASADLEVGLGNQGNAVVLRVPPGSPPGPFDFSWAYVLLDKAMFLPAKEEALARRLTCSEELELKGLRTVLHRAQL